MTQTMTISVLLPTLLGEWLFWRKTVAYRNILTMVTLIYQPGKLYRNLYTICLWNILQNLDINFQNSIRSYSSSFAFVSLGVNDWGHVTGRGILFKSKGHCLSKNWSATIKYKWIYIYICTNVHLWHWHWTIKQISHCYKWCESFRAALYIHARNSDGTSRRQGQIIKMVLRADASKDPRRYNLTTASEVALILPDAPQHFLARDFILYCKTEDHPQQKTSEKISETHPYFDPLHDVLFFFPLGEEGWATNIKLNRRRKEKVQVTVLCLQSFGEASLKCCFAWR